MVLNTDNVFEQTVESAADEYFIQEAEQALRPRLVVKLVDETVTSSTIMQDDDELFMSLSANCTYEFELNVLLAHQSGGVNHDLTIVGPTGSIGRFYLTATGGDISTEFIPTNLAIEIRDVFGAATTGSYSQIKGWIKVANISGNLQFKWAQYSSSVYWNKVLAGSWMKVTRQ